MTFLPIAERELRVLARKRSTFWLRVAFAVTGLLFGGACMALTGFRGFGGPRLGDILFYGITWPSAAAALAAGLFFTSDCLSEEKREGTLGFLFLTDLRGYEVVFGKLLATSLRGLYAFLALFPILAVALLMGGISGVHFWKTCLALVNTLLCSLSAGLFVSSISRDSQKALAGCLLLLILWTAAGPVADLIIALPKGRNFSAFWSLSSPGYSFVMAGAWGRSPYWWGLACSQLTAWILFGAACVLTPRTWQERSKRPLMTRSWVYRWKYGGPARRARLRRRLLDSRPMVWLTCRERWQSFTICSGAVVAAAGFIALLTSGLPFQAWMAWSYFGGALFTLVLYLWTASQASRLFVEARRSGLTELLLATPLDEKEIVRGQWRGLLRMFLVPVLVLMGLHVTGSALAQLSMRQMYAQASISAASATTTTATNRNSSTTVVYPTNAQTNLVASLAMLRSQSGAEQWISAFIAAAAAGLSTAGNLIALCWFGMWMGLTSKTANIATFKTLVFVQIVPGLIIYFTSTMLIMAVAAPFLAKLNTTAGASLAYMRWWPLLSVAITSLLALGKDIGFFVWSRKRLYFSFREQCARSLGQPRFAAPSPLPAVSAPPILTQPS